MGTYTWFAHDRLRDEAIRRVKAEQSADPDWIAYQAALSAAEAARQVVAERLRVWNSRLDLIKAAKISEADAGLLKTFRGCQYPEMYLPKVLSSEPLCRFLAACGHLTTVRLEGVPGYGQEDEIILPGVVLTTLCWQWELDVDQALWSQINDSTWVSKSDRHILVVK